MFLFKDNFFPKLSRIDIKQPQKLIFKYMFSFALGNTFPSKKFAILIFHHNPLL